jgi:hypothetical protein
LRSFLLDRCQGLSIGRHGQCLVVIRVLGDGMKLPRWAGNKPNLAAGNEPNVPLISG